MKDKQAEDNSKTQTECEEFTESELDNILSDLGETIELGNKSFHDLWKEVNKCEKK